MRFPAKCINVIIVTVTINGRGGKVETNSNGLRAKVTIDLDEKWASNLTPEELADTLKYRLNHALGFRGSVKKVKTVPAK